jgi:hypothetical protein
MAYSMALPIQHFLKMDPILATKMQESLWTLASFSTRSTPTDEEIDYSVFFWMVLTRILAHMKIWSIHDITMLD